jgi:hypothetical protein
VNVPTYKTIQAQLRQLARVKAEDQEGYDWICNKVEELEKQLATAEPELIYLSSTKEYLVPDRFPTPGVVEWARGYIYTQPYTDLRVATLEDGEWLVATVKGPTS